MRGSWRANQPRRRLSSLRRARADARAHAPQSQVEARAEHLPAPMTQEAYMGSEVHEPGTTYTSQWAAEHPSRWAQAEAAAGPPAAAVALTLMLLVLGRVLGGGGLGLWLLWAGALGLLTVLAATGYRLSSQVSHVSIDRQALAICTALDLWQGRRPRWFPLGYVNARYITDGGAAGPETSRSRLSLTYHDRVMVLRREAWHDADYTALAAALLAGGDASAVGD